MSIPATISARVSPADPKVRSRARRSASKVARLRASVALMVLAACCLAGAAGAAGAADPFYDRLLRDGIRAYDGGDYRLAADSLRLACFGLLDEPQTLARGLTHLALAQAHLDDQAAFASTFDRILEVERRFQAFSQLDLSTDLRRDLDGWLERWIASDVLDGVQAFRGAARLKLAAQVLALPVEERRPGLRRLAAAEPENPAWSLQLAELELASGDLEAALAAAGQVLSHDPELDRALCLRGQAGGPLNLCEQAVVDLDSCERLEASRALTALKLRCLVQLREWQSAAALLDQIPRASQRKAPFRQLGREIRKGLKAMPAPVPAAADDAPEVGVAGGAPTTIEPPAARILAPDPPAPSNLEPATSEPATPEPENPEPATPESEETREGPLSDDPGTWPAELTAELERLHRQVPGSSREQLRQALGSARELADRYPQLSEPQHLAAVIAYRLSRWQEAVAYFERGGEPGPSHPDRLFYLAVALVETGDRTAARGALVRCLPALEQTAFVRSYVEKVGL